MFKEIRSPEDYLEFFEVEKILRPLEWFGIEIPHDDLEHKWVKKEFSNGHYAIFQQKDGKRDGDYFQFHPDGHLEETILYHNGLKNGLAKWYAPDGHLEKEVPYHNGLRNGLEKRYHTDGKTLSKTCEMEDGKLNGLSTHYRRDGSKLSEMKFKDGKPVGLKRIFEKDGKTVAKEEPYTGTIKEFGLNGKTIRETKYVDGVPEIKEEGKLSAILRANSQPPKAVESQPVQQPQVQSPSQSQAVSQQPPQPTQTAEPKQQVPNWEMVGEGKTEVLAQSKEAFQKAYRLKKEVEELASAQTGGHSMLDRVPIYRSPEWKKLWQEQMSKKSKENRYFTQLHSDGTPLFTEYYRADGTVDHTEFFKEDGKTITYIDFYDKNERRKETQWLHEDNKTVSLKRFYDEDGKTTREEYYDRNGSITDEFAFDKEGRAKDVSAHSNHTNDAYYKDLMEKFKEMNPQFFKKEKQPQQPSHTPNKSPEVSYDLKFNSEGVRDGQNGAMKIDFSKTVASPKVPNQSEKQHSEPQPKRPISYMKKSFIDLKGGRR